MRLKQIVIAIDQLINTFFGGYAQETMSSRCWRLRDDQPYKTLQPIIDRLFLRWGPDHCKGSYENRFGYLPDETRP